MEVNNKANLNNVFKFSEQIINIHNWETIKYEFG